MGAGIPVTLHEHSYSRVLSSKELAYPDAYSWGESEELYRHLKSLSHEGLKVEGGIARIWYEKNYLPDNLQKYLDKPESQKFEVPPLSEKFKPNFKKISVSMVHRHRLTQISKFIYKSIYNNFKWAL